MPNDKPAIGNRRTVVRLLICAAAILLLPGCGNVQSFGVGPWPVYKEPEALSFDDNERTALQEFALNHAALFKRIQGQALSYRAIIREHNRRAKEMNLRQLKTIGFDEQSIKDSLSE